MVHGSIPSLALRGREHALAQLSHFIAADWAALIGQGERKRHARQLRHWPGERLRLGIADQRKQRQPVGGPAKAAPHDGIGQRRLLGDPLQRTQELAQQLQPLALDTLGCGCLLRGRQGAGRGFLPLPLEQLVFGDVQHLLRGDEQRLGIRPKRPVQQRA